MAEPPRSDGERRRDRQTPVPVYPGAGRPATVLHAAAQRWRSLFVDPIWQVRLAWQKDVQAASGRAARWVGPTRGEVLVLEVDADISDEAADLAVAQALAGLQMEELRLQCAAVDEQLRGRPPRAPHDAGGEVGDWGEVGGECR